MNAKEANLVLASTSPRRRELLTHLGIEFRVCVPSTVEDKLAHETPLEMVERLALMKARSAIGHFENAVIIGADSVVVLDGQVFGKPENDQQARQMLRELRGKEHQVVTGLAVIDPSRCLDRVASHVSTVTMREYSDAEMEAYVASGEPLDKAGGYAVQDTIFQPAIRVEDCFTNAMGLPLCRLNDMLKELDFEFGPSPQLRVPDQCHPCPLLDTIESGNEVEPSWTS